MRGSSIQVRMILPAGEGDQALAVVSRCSHPSCSQWMRARTGTRFLDHLTAVVVSLAGEGSGWLSYNVSLLDKIYTLAP